MSDLQPLTDRVAALETGMTAVKSDVAGVKSQVEGVKTQVEGIAATAAQVTADTAAIRKAVVGATKVGTFAKKHGRFVIGLLVGALYASGFLSPTTFHRIKVAMAYISLPPPTEGNANAAQ